MLSQGMSRAAIARVLRGRPLSMALHHVNGDGRDNRLENLQLLCPNCHSQTANFSARGRRLAVVPDPVDPDQEVA
jgi:5-methylcytosine-specific restriction endonuclease McrA